MLHSNFFECCIDCKDRHPGCHSECKRYLKAKKLNDEYNEMDRKRREPYGFIYERVVKTKEKL